MQYEFKKLIHKGICDKGFIWNPSNCECEINTNTQTSWDDSNLNYEHHIKSILNKFNKTIGLLRMIHEVLVTFKFLPSM